MLFASHWAWISNIPEKNTRPRCQTRQPSSWRIKVSWASACAHTGWPKSGWLYAVTRTEAKAVCFAMVAARAAAEGTKAFQWIHTNPVTQAHPLCTIICKLTCWVHTTCIHYYNNIQVHPLKTPSKTANDQFNQFSSPFMKNIGNSPFTSKPLRICVNPFCWLSALRSERFCPCTAKLPKWDSSSSCHKASSIDGHQAQTCLITCILIVVVALECSLCL